LDLFAVPSLLVPEHGSPLRCKPLSPTGSGSLPSKSDNPFEDRCERPIVVASRGLNCAGHPDAVFIRPLLQPRGKLVVKCLNQTARALKDQARMARKQELAFRVCLLGQDPHQPL
jgi:hypothetical protein